MKIGVQGVYKLLKLLDSGFCRNDEKLHFQSSYEFIKIDEKSWEAEDEVIKENAGKMTADQEKG